MMFFRFIHGHDFDTRDGVSKAQGRHSRRIEAVGSRRLPFSEGLGVDERLDLHGFAAKSGMGRVVDDG